MEGGRRRGVSERTREGREKSVEEGIRERGRERKG